MKKSINYWVIAHIILTFVWALLLFVAFIDMNAISNSVVSIWGPAALLSMLFQIAHMVYAGLTE